MPISDEFSTWQPPQNSFEIFPKLTTLTSLPYFSLNSEIAPNLFASSIGKILISEGIPSLINLLTNNSTSFKSFSSTLCG